MCLLVVASRVIPGTPLLIGANRDEVLDRPSTSATVLSPGDPRILGGRDEEAGGTWLAVNEHGVFAGLTNQPLGDGRDPTRRSRGELPLDLASRRDAPGAVEDFIGSHRPTDYNGSWLLVGDRQSLFFIDFTGVVDVDAVELGPGLHVLENRPLGALSPKADHVRDCLGSLTFGADGGGGGDGAGLGGAAGVSGVSARLEAVLADHQVIETVATEKGPRPISNCVHLDGYGTRSSCIVAIGDDPSTPPVIRVADGPPCTAPFVDVSALWSDRLAGPS